MGAMMRSRCRKRFVSIAFLMLGASGMAAAQGTAPKVKPPKPDLHAGGFNPSVIVNDATTEVMLPGFHLAGARVDSDHLCKIVSYMVLSDNQIKMEIKGTRKLEDDDTQCVITVRTPGGSVSSWIVVDFNEAQEAEYRKRKRTAEIAKAQVFQSRSGKAWHLKFADGAGMTYAFKENSSDGMPVFTSGAGDEVKISVTDDNNVSIIQSGCFRMGKLEGNQVKNGQSMGECTPSGAWTATVDH